MARKIQLPCALTAIMLLLVSLSILAFTSDKPVSKNSAAQALIDKVWAARDQDWDAQRQDRQIADLEAADRLDPNNHSILAYLAKTYFERGLIEEENGPADTERARKFYDRGYEVAKRSLAIKETSLGHYLAAINQGSSVAKQGVVSQARSFLEIKGHMDWIGRHDPNFHYGAYARFWLDCYQRAPDRIIALAGISKPEACGRLDASIKREPRYLENRVYQLTSCINPDNPAYLAALESALAIDPKSLPPEQSSNNYFHGELHKMWKTKTGKDHP